MITRSNLNVGHMGSKTRSLGQIKEKPCQLSRGHNFSPIFQSLALELFFYSDSLLKFDSLKVYINVIVLQCIYTSVPGTC